MVSLLDDVCFAITSFSMYLFFAGQLISYYSKLAYAQIIKIHKIRNKSVNIK